MRMGSSRRRHAGVGDGLVLGQRLTAHLRAPRGGRRGVDHVGAGHEYRAVVFLRRLPADIAASHIAREMIEITLERRAEATAAARAQDVGVARVQHLVERLAVVEALLLGGPEAVDGDRIAEPGEAAIETPGLALHPVHLRVETQVMARLHHLLATEPAAESAGAAGIRT